MWKVIQIPIQPGIGKLLFERIQFAFTQAAPADFADGLIDLEEIDRSRIAIGD